MILKQRMFRVKPYTKCLDCIKTDHLKCKNCMDKLVNDIMNSKDRFTSKQVMRKSPKSRYFLQNKYPLQQKSSSVSNPLIKRSSSQSSFRMTSTMSTPKQFQIHSKYELWMKHINSKKEQQKQRQQDPSKLILKQWPIKKRNYLSTIDIKHQDRKIQKWQQKFLDRIKNSSQKQQLKNQRQLKTSLAKLRV